ncbi:histone deacetylase family protein [Aquabacterium sp. OR-4]|uniref:histone deacetylase family protein n=1 Tax=Aquabacterium sp. OR-4 TaxID=2978127 RepID=UPI0021B4A580|nr:histone deacetylase family protein [Aquabacterium sp. OR-4]MDT7838331.1 histone deacetylase family protein [Aquabacterium sp. OR-4]
MRAFFCPDQLLHEPQQFMRLGRIHRPADVPARAEALRDTLQALGLPPEVPAEPPAASARAVLEAVHAPAYLDYLQHAHMRWQALAVPGLSPGPEVLPNLSPYPHPAGHALATGPGGVRPPCPSQALVAQTGWFISDLSCPIGPHTWRAVLRAAHTAAAAAAAVVAGAPLAYALCRPSGHHAHRDRAGGFCYVNNSAVAAQQLVQAFGRVAVLDVDAHHGDGTQQIFYDRGDVFTVSTHADPASYYPFYTGHAHERGAGAGEGCNLNLPLAHGSGLPEFAAALDQAALAIERFAPRALVLAMGFDSHRDDPISVLRFDHPAYRLAGERVRRLGLPTVVVQEGGYRVDVLGPGLRALLEGLGGLGRVDAAGPRQGGPA